MPNGDFFSLAMKSSNGPHDQRTIHRHRYTGTDHFRHTDGNDGKVRGHRVTDQLNVPDASGLPLATAIDPRTQLKVFRVAGWPLDNAKEFLIKKGHDLSGPSIIVKFPSWDRDRREFVPTPLVDLTDGRTENDDRSGDRHLHDAWYATFSRRGSRARNDTCQRRIRSRSKIPSGLKLEVRSTWHARRAERYRAAAGNFHIGGGRERLRRIAYAIHA